MKPQPAAERPWYKFQNAVKDGDKAADLYVYDVIGGTWDGQGVTARQFVADLEALPASVEKINLHINSPGGSVFDAVAIANVLRAHRAAVNVEIEGLAASAATVVAMAGARVGIAENAMFMVHNPYGMALGSAADMRATADALDRVRDAIVATYQWHTPLKAEAIGQLMDATTWMTAAEAVDKGFATEVSGATEAAAQADLEALAHIGPVPERFQARVHCTTTGGGTVKVPPPPIAAVPAGSASSPPDDAQPAAKGADDMTDAEITALVDRALAEGREAGATAERERILGIEGAALPGHEALVAELKRDPKVTPGDAALRINAAERATREQRRADMRADGAVTAVVQAVAGNPAGDDGAPDLSRRPIEDQAKHTWDTDPAVRAEFENMGGWESYLAWRQVEASGQARILKAVK